VIVLKKTLDIEIIKDNKEYQTMKDITYEKDNNKIKFILDDTQHLIVIDNESVEFIRENKEFLFNLKISQREKISKYLLKAVDGYFNINVENGKFNINDNELLIEYKLESDEQTTMLKIILKENII
jgi:hypothetical protein